MSTYPVDVKAVQKHTVATHTVFAGPGRIVEIGRASCRERV